jgi:hypothetical protein
MKSRLDGGTNITISSSNKKRAVVAVLAAGILLSVAITVAADAWLRRRRQRAIELANETEPTPEVIPTPEATPIPDAIPTPTRERPEVVKTSTLTMQRILASGGTNGSTSLRHPADSRAKGDDRGSDATIAIRTGFVERDLPADATVVLPKAMPMKDK